MCWFYLQIQDILWRITVLYLIVVEIIIKYSVPSSKQSPHFTATNIGRLTLLIKWSLYIGLNLKNTECAE
jgi:hypothetical protein